MTTYLHYALVIPEDFAQLTFHHTMAGIPDEMIVTLGCREDVGDLEQPDLDGLRDDYVTHLLPNFSTAVTFDKVTARDAGGVFLESYSGDNGAGAGAYGPVSNAVLVEKRTGVSGRRNRGRMYFPWAAESAVDATGTVDAAIVTALQADVDAFLAAAETTLGAAPGGLYLLHSKGWGTEANPNEPEPPDPGNAPAPTRITQLIVKNKIGTQRRRLR